ncbi:uncharacterized protein C12orf56-like isoform X3 [Ostrea edulis]|uniref:uncharacterized protein C12orf56-like isoform X3 n=1 Tax=Ostrea edulis TaxID=37623 RepID=UPI0024AFAEBA|nr:uncharacterized protein C12orf56-like isoform X3 [Ostrea edulis]
MARGNADVLFKKNSKLESFLKRTLPEEAFERVRGYEACIIVTEKENKGFKYCVLDDEFIYQAENPPKSREDLQIMVPLKEIISVDLVNDFPDFLSGEERTNTQHIQVVHWTSDQIKKRSFRKSKKSPRAGSLSDLHGDRSNASTPLENISLQEGSNWSEDYGYITQSTSSLQINSSRPESRGSVNSLQGLKPSGREIKTSSLKKKKRIGDGMEDSYLKALKEEMEDGQLEDVEDIDGVLSTSYTSILQSTRGSKAKEGQRMSTDRRGSTDTTVSQTGSVRRPLPRAPSVSQENKSNVVNNQNDTSTDPEKPQLCNCFSLNCFRSSRVSCGSDSMVTEDSSKKPVVANGKSPDDDVFFVGSSLPQKPEINIDVTSDLASQGHKGSMQSLVQEPIVNSRRSSVTTIRGPSRAGTPALEFDGTRSASVLGMTSVSDFGSSIIRINTLLSPEERKKTTVSIYLLNLQSPMLMLIRSAWNNYLIKHTLNIDIELDKSFKSSAVRSGPIQRKSVKREKMEVLFNALKRDLLSPENSMEDTFSLLNELKTATEKNFTLKKLFWKNADMFLFLVRQTQRYLPKSPVNVNTEHGRVQRADELELVILLTEILSLMFRESEIIPARIQTLKADRGKAIFDLIRLLICSPEVPEKMAAPSKSTQDLQATDEEIKKQIEEYRKSALLALFEIFLMARQANWGNREASFFNISWVIKTMEEMRMTEAFVENIIDQMMKFIGPTRKEALMPQEAVTLYVQFSVLQTFLHYSPKISAFIRNHYLEEFKYFVQVPVVMKKLPQSYPICLITVTLIESVTNKVLDQGTSVFPKSPR